jgi:hypothetical protein
VRELVDEVEVEGDGREVVAEARLHVGAEVQAIDEGTGFVMGADIELIGID